MHLLTLGLNHETAPLALREKVAFAGASLPMALRALKQDMHARLTETAILSTCNRTELYGMSADPHAAHTALSTWLAQQGGLRSQAELLPHLYTFTDRAAVRHLFRVASGLNSMVLGEPQILGQLKEAARIAHAEGCLGATLHQLLQHSFSVAKGVRTRTPIGNHAASMASVGVRLAQRLFEDLRTRTIVLVGAGAMIENVARHFLAQQPRRVVVANRTPERAAALAQRLRAESMPLSALAHTLHTFDIVVACTASSLPLIGLGMVERALRARRHQPLFILDLGVPRDIEPEVARLPDVFLYTVDDLGARAQDGMEQRRAAVTQADAIIDAHVEQFLLWLHKRAAVPHIKALRSQGHACKDTELARARRMLARGVAPADVLEHFAHALTNKLLHGPSLALQAPPRLAIDWIAHPPQRARPDEPPILDTP